MCESEVTADTEPRVSVVVPSYNRARRLPEALASIISQTVKDVEILVVDDGSTDETEAAVRRAAPAARYLARPHQGAGAARNAGIAAARGRYIALLDSDDLWLPNKLAVELAVLEADPAVDAVVSDCEGWRDGVLVVRSWSADAGVPVSATGPTRFDPPARVWVWRKPYATSSIILRRSALRKLGSPPFAPDLPVYEDFGFAIRLHHALRVVAIPEVLCRVRRFREDIREGRPVPGTPSVRRVKAFMAYHRYCALRRARDLGWPNQVAAELDAALVHSARVCAAHGRASRSTLRVITLEVRRGAPRNALVSLALAILPNWTHGAISSGVDVSIWPGPPPLSSG
jgi:glycosyltransferase involved in cell wall biosynthesis